MLYYRGTVLLREMGETERGAGLERCTEVDIAVIGEIERASERMSE